jgi:inosine-uridine nucleoside N-ribohydrolase
MVHQFPHQITVYEGGPMTNLALAISLDPHFAKLTQGLVFMGGSFNPHTTDPEFASDPRHEFNMWFDPEAAHIVLRAAWPRITCTPVDASIQTHFTRAMLERISRGTNAAAKYLAHYARPGRPDYMWDELAALAWVDPALITEEKYVYMDVNLDRGAEYGDTLTWTEKNRPETETQLVHVQMKVDTKKFDREFVDLMTRSSNHP